MMKRSEAKLAIVRAVCGSDIRDCEDEDVKEEARAAVREFFAQFSLDEPIPDGALEAFLGSEDPEEGDA